jgi:DNA polymerase I-like protein with 3'-5' exonuclease and polymerase domains
VSKNEESESLGLSDRVKLKGNNFQTAGGVWVVDSLAEADQLLQILWSVPSPTGCDLEYTFIEGRHVLDHARITCMTLGWPDGEYLGVHPSGAPLHRRVFVPAFEDDRLVQIFKPWLESDAPKVGHNIISADAHVLRNHGIVLRGIVADTLRKSRMAYNSKDVKHGLKPVMARELGYEVTDLASIDTRPRRLKSKTYKTTSYRPAPKDSPLYGTGIKVLFGAGEVARIASPTSKKAREVIPHAELWRDYPHRRAAFVDYATLDAKATAELDYVLSKRLAKLPAANGSNLDLYNDKWHPFCQLIASMEVAGIGLDVEQCRAGAVKAAADVKYYDDKLKELADINWGAPKQLAQVLFRQWNLPRPAIKGTLKGIKPTKPAEWSTSESSIHWLELECPEYREALGWVRKRRKASRYYGYLRDWPLMVHADGRIHPVLVPDTTTGRLACSTPPLQQAPGADSDKYGIRRAFVAGPGKTLIVADYSQLEVYVLAHFLLKLFNDDSVAQALATGDVYGAVAKQCWPNALAGVEATEIKEHPDKAIREYRKTSKIVVLAKNYCKTDQGLAVSLLDETGRSVGLDYARGLMLAMDNGFPGIPQLQRYLADFAKRHGGIPTILGRWRPIPECRSEREYEKSAGDRKAANTPMQGSGQDIMMCAGLALERHPRLQELGVQQLLDIHDEKILECDIEVADEVLGIVVDTMEHPPGIEMRVPLKVVAKTAPSWAEGK